MDGSSLFSSKFLAMRNITLYSVYSVKRNDNLTIRGKAIRCRKESKTEGIVITGDDICYATDFIRAKRIIKGDNFE